MTTEMIGIPAITEIRTDRTMTSTIDQAGHQEIVTIITVIGIMMIVHTMTGIPIVTVLMIDVQTIVRMMTGTRITIDPITTATTEIVTRLVVDPTQTVIREIIRIIIMIVGMMTVTRLTIE
ncbi:hypothetical protein GCM10027592_00460 [Spirosoma flavus]